MSSIPALAPHRERILAIAARHGATNVRVFGSVARGEAGPASDLDLLVDMEPNRTLLDRIGLVQELQQSLGRKVDVVTDKSLYWLLRRRILNEALPL
jgi:predicted nucleotidyltransferase